MAARRPTKMYTVQEALAIIQALPDVDSGSSEEDSFICESEFIPTDSSSDEDVPAPTGSQMEQPLPMRQTRKRTKKRIIVDEEEDEKRSTSVKGKSSKLKQGKRHPKNKPLEETAKDGTVWVQRQIEDFSTVQTTQTTQTSFTNSGPTEFARCRGTSRLQSFLCLFDISVLLTIRECTVHKARKTNPDWSTSVEELMAFIAVLFFRGAAGGTGAMRDCWSKNFGIPVIMSTMSRDRYQELMAYLRFHIKDTRFERSQTDTFAAISDIWQRFVQNCVLSYNPGQHITVDEQLFPTKVRCPFLQYIASKPDKFGTKFWIAADLDTKYMCNAMPYLGKDSTRPVGERLSESVVTRLMEPFLDRGRTRVATHLEIREFREKSGEKKFDEKVREFHEKLSKSGKSQGKINLCTNVAENVEYVEIARFILEKNLISEEKN